MLSAGLRLWPHRAARCTDFIEGGNGAGRTGQRQAMEQGRFPNGWPMASAFLLSLFSATHMESAMTACPGEGQR